MANVCVGLASHEILRLLQGPSGPTANRQWADKGSLQHSYLPGVSLHFMTQKSLARHAFAKKLSVSKDNICASVMITDTGSRSVLQAQLRRDSKRRDWTERKTKSLPANL
jgi:hypothetical protein